MTDSDDDGVKAWRVADDDEHNDTGEAVGTEGEAESENTETEPEGAEPEAEQEEAQADEEDETTTPLEAVAQADAASKSAESEATDAEEAADGDADITPADATTVGETETGSVERILDEEAGVVVYTYESDQRSNITTIPLKDTLLADQ